MYLTVITLEQAKNHLRIDEDFNADNEAIERMIRSALELIEVNTNHLVYARDKDYFRLEGNSLISVFDYPINSIPEGVTVLNYSLNNKYAIDKITLNVGYLDAYDVPNPLIDSALMLIENWYYGTENKGLEIPLDIKQILMNYKRCIVV